MINTGARSRPAVNPKTEGQQVREGRQARSGQVRALPDPPHPRDLRNRTAIDGQPETKRLKAVPRQMRQGFPGRRPAAGACG